MVQRIRDQAEHGRALRSQDAEIPELDDRSGGDIVRNMDVTRDGNFVLANSLVNAVTLVEIDK